MSCAFGSCGLGPIGQVGARGPIYGDNRIGSPFECGEGYLPANTAATFASSGYYRPGGYGYVFGYGAGYGSIHDGFRRACCFPNYFPGAQCNGCRPGLPQFPGSYAGWW